MKDTTTRRVLWAMVLVIFFVIAFATVPQSLWQSLFKHDKHDTPFVEAATDHLPWEFVVSDKVLCGAPQACGSALERYLVDHPKERIASVVPVDQADCKGTCALIVLHTTHAEAPWPHAQDLRIDTALCREGCIRPWSLQNTVLLVPISTSDIDLTLVVSVKPGIQYSLIWKDSQAPIRDPPRVDDQPPWDGRP